MSELSPVRDRRSPQLHHSFTVKLSASGSPARWMAAIGDFSWDFATEHCGVNVLRAYDPEGKPDYLAFCYIRILGGAGFPCNAISL